MRVVDRILNWWRTRGEPEAQPTGLPRPTDIIVVSNCAEKIRNYKCGHRGPVWFALNTYGAESKKIGSSKTCPDCTIGILRQMVIRCALCGLPIFPGEGVALYSRASSQYKSIATKVGKNFIGCLRWECCPSGGFYAGHWTGENGFRPAYGGDTAVGHAYATGKPVIVNVDE
jgi:hypothetical protein